MSLLQDIQNAAIDSTTELTDLLRRCVVLSVRLNYPPLKAWANFELNGYPADVELPEYRVRSVQSFGNFSGPFGSSLSNMPIPPMCIPEEHRYLVSEAQLRNGVAFFVDAVRSREEGIKAAWPADLVPLVAHRIIENMSLLQAWRYISKGAIAELLDTIRNRVLNFVLEIEDLNPQAGEPVAVDSTIPAPVVQHVFVNHIWGSNNTIATGAVGLQQAYVVTQGDVSSLTRVLKELQLPSEDIEEIESILKNTSTPEFDRKRTADKARQWLGKMATKASTGAWSVGSAAATGAVAKFLEDALKMYFGIAR